MGDLPILVSARLAFACGGLALFLLWETSSPFRAPRQPRLSHYATNVALGLSNVIVLRLAFGGFLFWLAELAEHQRIGVLNFLAMPPIWKAVCTVILFDLITYVAHRWLHRSPLLWRLHKVHHSDLDFDVTTGIRFHTLEVLLSAGIRAAAVLLLGASVVGVAAFETALLFSSQFQHSNLRLPENIDRRIRWLTVTPSMHRIHHSERPEEMNSNFSTIFSWWDRLLGSYRETVRQEEIVVGLREARGGEGAGLLALLRMPFAGASARLPRMLPPQQLREQLSRPQPPLVLDVRNPDEFVGDLGHIEGAIPIPLPELDAKLDQLIPYRQRRIVAV
jgi:sterol desaturase/sphingolipid hydroxylase (fatty acid hydroxylase superfamily)